MTVNKNIARLAEGIRARRQTDTGDDPDTDQISTMDALRSVARADSDARLAAHLAKRTTPTTETEV